MTTEAQENKETPAEPTAKAPPASSPASVATSSPAGANGPSGTDRVRLADDDDLPNDSQLLELSSAALAKRLKRHSSKELREHFGTSDPEEIKAKLAKLADYESKEEEARRARLEEKTRLEEDLAKERTRAEAAEARAKSVQEERIVEKEERRISRLAEKHVDPDYVEDVLPKLRSHLLETYSEKQLSKLTDSDIESFFKKLVESKPKLGKDFSAPVVEAKKPETKPLTNGVGDARPAPASAASTAPEYRPGKPNSMSRAEAKAAAAKEGLHW